MTPRFSYIKDSTITDVSDSSPQYAYQIGGKEVNFAHKISLVSESSFVNFCELGYSDSNAYLLPKNVIALSNRTQCLFTRGETQYWNMFYVRQFSFTSTATATLFGSIVIKDSQVISLSNSTIGMTLKTGLSSVLTFSTSASFSEFTTSSEVAVRAGWCGSPTRGLIGGGVFVVSSTYVSTSDILKIEIGSNASAISWGSLAQPRSESFGGYSNGVKGVFTAGMASTTVGTYQTVIISTYETVIIASEGTMSDYGDFVSSDLVYGEYASTSSSTRGITTDAYQIRAFTIATGGLSTRWGTNNSNDTFTMTSDSHGGLASF